MRVKLLTYMKEFYDDQIELNPKSSDNIVFGKLKDESTVFHLADILNSHKINIKIEYLTIKVLFVFFLTLKINLLYIKYPKIILIN